MSINKAFKSFGDALIREILEEYKSKGFRDTGNLENQLVWDNKNRKLFAPGYFFTLTEGRKPGRFAPVNAIFNWVRRKRIQFRNFVTGRFMSQRSTAFLINRSLAERGSQVYRNRRQGIDLGKATQRAADKTADEFGDAFINELFN